MDRGHPGGSTHRQVELLIARLHPAMLVLSRKKNESIVVNSDIVITVIEIRGDKVRLGIVAPKDVPVHREEVYQAIHGHSPVKPAVEATGTT
jgi:carbon storage regulator